jgi:tetratricopeptide (TPR) repeat protein
VKGLRHRLRGAVARLLRGDRPRGEYRPILNYFRRSNPLLERARRAQLEKRWSDAIRLWQVYGEAKPSDILGAFNLGTLYLSLGRIADAAACAAQMRARWPRRAEGALLAARSAASGQTPERKVVIWRAAAAEFPSSPIICEEFGGALLETGTHSEAGGILRRLQSLDRRASLRLEGRMLSVSGSDADRNAFWRGVLKEFPGDRDFLRKAIHATLQAGSLDAAEYFDALLRSGNTQLADVNFAMGLANLYRLRNDRDTQLRVIRAYLKAMEKSADYRVAALKLSRMIFADFPRADADAKTAPARFRKMLLDAPVTPAPKAWLLDVCALYDRMVAASRASLLETDISRDQCETFVGLVRDRLSAGKPFSLVRLGDAEASALPYEPELQCFSEGDARERERSWWGRELAFEERATIAGRVASAIWSADALGIPCAGRVIRDMDLKSEEVLSTGRSGRGVRTIMHAIGARLAAGSPPPVFVSFGLHQDLHKHGVYPALFAGARDVVCVSSHPGLPQFLIANFGVVSATNITLRSAFSLRGKVDQAANAYVLPDQCDDVVASLGDRLDGRLVIVAAGYLGKWISREAANRGGVALDLGSVPDYWMGRKTRAYLDIA